MSPQPKCVCVCVCRGGGGVCVCVWGGGIAFGADPVCVGVCIASCLHSYHLNQWVDFDQTFTDTLLGGERSD